MLAEWETIAPPRDNAALNVLRADPAHPLDFRIGRDVRGRFAFQLDAPGGLSEAAEVDSPAGMDVAVDDLGDGVGRLTLLLHDSEDFAIFRVLCGDLLEVTRALAPAEASRAMGILLGRLGQWQEVLARRRRGRLSRNEAMGLFGELVFLRDVLAPRGRIASAVAAWRGPYGDEQDFAVADVIVEVKTHGTTSDGRIQISSEHQLDTSSVTIFLCRQCAAPRPSDAGGESLDQVVVALLRRDLWPRCGKRAAADGPRGSGMERGRRLR